MVEGKSTLTDVGVLENEPCAQLVLQPVHLTTDDAEQCLAVDQYSDTVLLYALIECAGLVDVFQVVCQARASSVLNTHSHKF